MNLSISTLINLNVYLFLALFQSMSTSIPFNLYLGVYLSLSAYPSASLIYIFLFISRTPLNASLSVKDSKSRDDENPPPSLMFRLTPLRTTL